MNLGFPSPMTAVFQILLLLTRNIVFEMVQSKQEERQENFHGPFTLGGDIRASSASPPVWATATCASDEQPVIDEVAIHRHPASCNIGASLNGCPC